MSDLTIPHPRPSRPQRIGRYRIIDRIGKGAMGIVYSARDDEMDRDVALKMMVADFEAEPEIRARFMREAQVSAKLAHRNIVTIFDIGDDEGRLYIVMELLRGQSLADCMKSRQLTLEQKVDIVLQVCEALAVSSAAGVFHRDVKPGNLFVLNDGSVKVLDFGIARLASSSMTATGYIVGTPDYMSPEQASGAEVDERSDIFSVGAVLYHMLSGQKPFAAPDLPAVLNKVVSQDPPPLAEDTVPPTLAQITLRALAKSPADRYQSFRELSADLTRFKRRYEAETSAIALEALKTWEHIDRMLAEEEAACTALGVAPQFVRADVIAAAAAGLPQLVDRGMDALRVVSLRRVAAHEIQQRLDSVRSAMEPYVAMLRVAYEDFSKAQRAFQSRDLQGALNSFESSLTRVPSPVAERLVEECRQKLKERRALEARAASLLLQAAEERRAGHTEAALELARSAVDVLPGQPEAEQLVAALRDQVQREAAERRERAERSIELARRALAKYRLEEAEEHLEAARSADPNRIDVKAVAAQLRSARTVRDATDSLLRDITRQITAIRAQFDTGHRREALDELQALSAAHPDVSIVTSELTRLRADDERLTRAETERAEAERLVSEAEAAWSAGSPQEALRLANGALERVPSHEPAIRLASRSRARLREVAEREARSKQAAELVARARPLFERGRPDRALSAAREAADLDPGNTEAAALIGEILRTQSAAEQSRLKDEETARQARTIRTAIVDAKTALAAGLFDDARQRAEDVLSLDPANDEAREILTQLSAALALLAPPKDEDDTVNYRQEEDPDDTAAIPKAAPAAAAAAAPSEQSGSTVRRGTHSARLRAVEWLSKIGMKRKPSAPNASGAGPTGE